MVKITLVEKDWMGSRYVPSKGEIVVVRERDSSATVAVLTHELAHWQLKHEGQVGTLDEIKQEAQAWALVLHWQPNISRKRIKKSLSTYLQGIWSTQRVQAKEVINRTLGFSLYN